MKGLGVFGGTFDPIHNGHLALAEAAYQQFSLEKVIFIPANDPPHKNISGVTSFQHRFNMAKLAIEDEERYEISDLETNRKGKSYTVDTVKILQEMYPNQEVYFLTGADSLYDLTTWHQWENLLDLCYFVTVTRKGFDFEEFKRDNPEMVKAHYKKGIRFLDMPPMNISSTLIRSYRKEHQSIKGLVPEKVWQYINDHGLYLG